MDIGLLGETEEGTIRADVGVLTGGTAFSVEVEVLCLVVESRVKTVV